MLLPKFLIYGESIFISFQDMKPPMQIQQGVCHTVALPFTLKSILRQKEELWELKYFTMQKYNISKIL
jgi:hypothetical protein